MHGVDQIFFFRVMKHSYFLVVHLISVEDVDHGRIARDAVDLSRLRPKKVVVVEVTISWQGKKNNHAQQ